MNEAVTARDKLLKFTERLDRGDAAVQVTLILIYMLINLRIQIVSLSHVCKCENVNYSQLRELPKMEAVATSLGELYDDLAKLQADAKIQDLGEKRLGTRTSFDVYNSCTLQPSDVCHTDC